MAETTGIEWTDATFNPWIGCTAVSPACDRCYAKALVERWGGNFDERRHTAPANWRKPLAWNARAAAAGKRMKVFCASLADVFDNQVAAEWRDDLWTLIRATPMLDWQLLTKRPQNIAKMLPPDWGKGWPNVWLGTTVENQTEADRRIPKLLAVPAAVHFLSCEPLLGPVDLEAVMAPCTVPEDEEDGLTFNCLTTGDYYQRVDDLIHAECGDGPWREHNIAWVICGGESGHGARPMNPAWLRSMRNQCQDAGVAFFFKQWGEWAPYCDTAQTPDGTRNAARGRGAEAYRNLKAMDEHHTMTRIGKKSAGATLDGREHKEFPRGR